MFKKKIKIYNFSYVDGELSTSGDPKRSRIATCCVATSGDFQYHIFLKSCGVTKIKVVRNIKRQMYFAFERD